MQVAKLPLYRDNRGWLVQAVRVRKACSRCIDDHVYNEQKKKKKRIEFGERVALPRSNRQSRSQREETTPVFSIFVNATVNCDLLRRWNLPGSQWGIATGIAP